MKKVIQSLVKDLSDDDFEKNVTVEIRLKSNDDIIGKCKISEILKRIEEQTGEINKDYYLIKPSVYLKKKEEKLKADEKKKIDDLKSKKDHEKWVKENTCTYCGSPPGWEHDFNCPTRGYNRF